MFDNVFFKESFGVLVYAMGLVAYVSLFISCFLNYDKNRSYAVGGFFILGSFLFLNVLAAWIPDSETILPSTSGKDLMDWVHIFFFSFGIFISFALLFYFFMSGIQMILERVG